MGLAYNLIPDSLWTKFQQHRKPGYQHERPSLVYWEYGKEDEVDENGNKLKGYWTAMDMVYLCGEFTDLFEFLYGEDGCGV